LGQDTEQAIFFYNRHPISADIILTKLRASRGDLAGLQPEELFPHDQDHYGGVAANDELAKGAAIGKGTRVADFCAGLGGPARYLAHRYGAHVTGIELTAARVTGAQKLTSLVGLQEKVRIVEGNVMAVSIDTESVDVVVSQEALLHIPDRRRALGVAFRVLKRGGRLAFTDWVAHQPLDQEDKDLLSEGQAVQALESPASYRDLLSSLGFHVRSVADLTAEWAIILKDRLAMYRRLREETERAGTPSGHDAFYRSYVRFVDLVQQHVLGGVRVFAEK
jgi:ubiquinone/menaquinone biosynthesis C-methylase UbiE